MDFDLETTMSQGPFPRKHPDAAFREIGDEGGLVVLPNQAQVKVLNPVGIRIFSLLDGAHSEDAIVREITAEFEVSEPEAREHLIEFLDELAAHGMLDAGVGASASEESNA